MNSTMSAIRKFLFTTLLLCFVVGVQAQIPSYYSNLDFDESGEPFKEQLSTLITDTHFFFLPYTGASVDTWGVLKSADLDTENTQQVLLVYGYDNSDDLFRSDRSRDVDSNCTTSGCIGLWNREHVYPRSIANPNLEVNFPGPGTDAHNLRASDSQMNSSRGNRIFESGSGNAGITAQGNFYPGDEWKGDVARMMMYMYVRYTEQCLANDIAFSSNNSHVDMPDLLLQWNAEDPVSDFEMQRNDVISGIQGNRNPFIDNPYLATIIWGGTPAEDTWQLLSTQDLSATPQFSIYPTLTSDYIYIKDSQTGPYQITLIDYSGRLLMKTTTNQPKIDVSALGSGYYILNVNNSSTAQSFKFLKR